MARPKNPNGTFSNVARAIRGKGRVAGFELMRDYLLDNWDSMKGQMNPYSALKAILEVDRHALFAEVAELRKQGTQSSELSAELSAYLQAKTDIAPDASGERSLIEPSTYTPRFRGVSSLLTEGEEETDVDETEDTL